MMCVVEASVRLYGGIRTDPSTSLRMTWGKIASSCLLAMIVMIKPTIFLLFSFNSFPIQKVISKKFLELDGSKFFRITF